jgi:hypothetical protein
VAAVEYTFTHKQYTEYRERNIRNNKKTKFGKCEPCPVIAGYTLAFALQLRKKHVKTKKKHTEQYNKTMIEGTLKESHKNVITVIDY